MPYLIEYLAALTMGDRLSVIEKTISSPGEYYSETVEALMKTAKNAKIVALGCDAENSASVHTEG